MWKILFVALVANSFSTFLAATSGGCDGDANATSGCDTQCVMRCPTSSEDSSSCSCPENNSCQCKSGFLFNPITFTCVLPKDCPNYDGNDICTLNDDTDDYGPITTRFATTNCYPTQCPDAVERLRRSLITYNFKTLYLFAVQNPVNSFIGSVLATFFFLFQIALFSTGNQYVEILNALMLKNKEEIGCVSNSIHADVNQLPTSGFGYGQDIFANCNFPFTNCFKNVMETVISGEAVNLNLNSSCSANYINNEITNQTMGMVLDVITPSNILNSYTEMGLASGVYFSVPWKYAFDPQKEQQGYFSAAPNVTYSAQFLTQTEYFNYTESATLNTKFVEIPFNNSNLSILIGLPNVPFTEAEPLKKLQDPDVYDSLRKSLKSTLIDLSIPVQKKSYLWNSVNTLKQTGLVSSIFNRSTVQYDENAFVGDMFPIVNFGRQRINVKTTLQGGQSAKETYSSSEKRVTFNANYRLFYIIILNGYPLVSALVGIDGQQECMFNNNY